MSRKYKCLTKGEFSLGDHQLVSIRDEDKYAIQEWRNEQVDTLRQTEQLTTAQQEGYFRNVVDKLFETDRPSQLLFSFLKEGELIGYGGLVHIDWESRNGEMSFLLATSRDAVKETFIIDFSVYLKILQKIAFDELGFVKVHTTVFDIGARRNYIGVIENFGFAREATLKRHVMIRTELCDVLVYSYFNT